MGGILGGVLGGLALGALFSSLGFGGMSAMLGQIMTFALLGFLALVLFRFFTRKKTASPSYQNNNTTPFRANQGSNDAGAPLQRSAFDAPKPDAPSFNGGAFDASAPAFASAAQTTLPAGVNEADFLRQTKASFIRMQAAWDKADALDIHGFTTPELYAELRLQLQERGAAPNVTDVQSLNAEILASEETTQASFISVKLSGRIKESPDQAAEDFVEIWHMAKTASDSDWRLAGIEQPV
jgi:predicted lipid-binding transport protein (Tim44 family)